MHQMILEEMSNHAQVRSTTIDAWVYLARFLGFSSAIATCMRPARSDDAASANRRSLPTACDDAWL